MEIRKININFNKIKELPKCRNNIGRLNADTFEKSQAASFKGRMDLISVLDKDYDELTESEKTEIRSELSKYDWDTVDDCLNTAKTLKNLYDEQYGEGEWEYVAIGRSCANVAKTLNQLGIKTYIIPISGLQGGIQNGEELTEQEGFEKYKKYIYDLGLNPEKVENSGKTYIFQDYCDSGKSLRIFEEFIRSDKMGLNKPNIIFKGINESLFESVTKLPDWGLAHYNPFVFISRLASQNTPLSMKKYTSTPKLYYRDLEDIEKINDAPMLHHKLFDFGIKDRIKAAP